jgi:hypothetical protein
MCSVTDIRNRFYELSVLCGRRNVFFISMKCIISTGLWRRYINITVTILDIIHHLVFYLKLNSTL